MFAQMVKGLDFQAQALVLRGERQRVIASNIANADTPGYAARDLDFKQAMASALGEDSELSGRLVATTSSSAMATPNARHFELSDGSSSLAYTVQTQPSIDSNSVDLDRERANFVDNAVRYEATLRFINGHSKTILSAIQGQ